jgi:hypothetical protein
MKIHIAESQYDPQISPEFWEQYQANVTDASHEVSKLLPFGSPCMNFLVLPRTYDFVEGRHDNGYTHNSELIELAFDPTCGPEGLQTILDGVRPMVFHEINHAARFNIPIWHHSFLDNSLFEGLATVFAREHAQASEPWDNYPSNVADWVQEIIDKNDSFNTQEYRFNHPDGRKWITYKVGTYMTDQAMQNSGKSVIELSQMECADILKLADINTTDYRPVNSAV